MASLPPFSLRGCLAASETKEDERRARRGAGFDEAGVMAEPLYLLRSDLASVSVRGADVPFGATPAVPRKHSLFHKHTTVKICDG